MKGRRTWFDEDRTHFQCIVIGCGGIGSAAVYWLSKRLNSDVLGIEQFELGHHNGGSQDHSRIMRMAYHDDLYTRLTKYSFEAFEQVEKDSGLQLLHRCGGLDMGKPKDVNLDSYASAMDKHNIRYERLDADQLREKFPQFEVDKDVISLYQPDSGLVDAALSNSVHQQLARGYGASIISNCPVINIFRNNSNHISVLTTRGTYTCHRLIITAGAWVNKVLAPLGINLPIKVTQEQCTYFGTSHIKQFTKDKFPMFSYHHDGQGFYVVPVHGIPATKIGIDAVGKEVTADTRDFTPCPHREKVAADFIEKIVPNFTGPIIKTKTCLYAMTPDRHFIIDNGRHVGFPDVIICNGAGHAYKFSCLLGKILSEMAIDGKTQYDISGFSINREAITCPEFKSDIGFGGFNIPNKSKL